MRMNMYRRFVVAALVILITSPILTGCGSTPPTTPEVPEFHTVSNNAYDRTEITFPDGLSRPVDLYVQFFSKGQILKLTCAVTDEMHFLCPDIPNVPTQMQGETDHKVWISDVARARVGESASNLVGKVIRLNGQTVTRVQKGENGISEHGLFRLLKGGKDIQ